MSFIGVDHVCATVNDTDSLARNFADLGMSIVFHERDVEVAALKAPVMREVSPLHHMLLLRPQVGMLFEAIDHGTRPSDNMGPFQVLLSLPECAKSENPSVVSTAASAAFNADVFAGKIPGSNIDCMIIADAKKFLGVQSVILSRADLDGAQSFWIDGLGFKETRRDPKNNWSLLTFTSPVPSWSHSILLVRDGDNLANQLDDMGWTCLSMLTSNMDDARKRVVDAGGKIVTEVYEVPADGKMLKLCFARGKTGELLELLDMRSTV